MFGEGEARNKKEEERKRCPKTVHIFTLLLTDAHHPDHFIFCLISFHAWSLMMSDIWMYYIHYWYVFIGGQSVIWSRTFRLFWAFLCFHLWVVHCSLLTPGSHFKTDRNKTLYSDDMGDPLNSCVLWISHQQFFQGHACFKWNIFGFCVIFVNLKVTFFCSLQSQLYNCYARLLKPFE